MFSLSPKRPLKTEGFAVWLCQVMMKAVSDLTGTAVVSCPKKCSDFSYHDRS